MKKIVGTIFLLLIFALPAYAQNQLGETPCAEGTICLNNPLGVDTPQVLIARIINNVLGIVGTLALVMFIYGGLIWMTSSGSSEKVKQGRDIILWSVIGLVVIFSAYAIVRFVLQGIGA